MRSFILGGTAFLLGFSCLAATAQDTYPSGTFQLTPAEDLGLEPVPLVVANDFKDLLPANPVLHLPPGFSAKVFAAAGLSGPRMMAVGPDGVLHVANMRRYNYNETNSQIAALPDRDLDGLADTVRVVADGLRMVNSIAFYKGELYAAATDQVLRLVDGDGDGFYEEHQVVVDQIPTRGQHLTRTIVFDRQNDKLYVSIGSSCNVCREDSPEEAAILQFDANGGGRRIFARGLRNAVGMTLHPVTNQLWATNNGHDQDGFQNGRSLPPEWVGIVRDGGFYGWPLAYGFQAYIDFSIGEFERAIFPISAQDSLDVASMTRPEVMLPAHSAPMGIHFYTGDLLPERFHGAGFVAVHAGARGTEPGYKVAALFAEPDGSNARVADFMTGFRPDPTVRRSWGTPMDIATDAQGNLFVSNDNLFIGEPGFIVKVVPRRLQTDWTVDMPAAVLAGVPFELEVGLELGALDSAGDAPVVSADLSEFGGGAAVPLEASGDGAYRLATRIEAAASGEKTLSIRVEQQTAYDLLTDVLRQRVSVFPAADLVVLDDQLAETWTGVGRGGAELLAFDSKAPVFAGAAAAPVQIVDRALLGWNFTLAPEVPVVGLYLALRFAFHPGDTGASQQQRLSVGIKPGKSINLDGEGLVDLGAAEWQLVEIPLEDFELRGPIEEIAFSGFTEGVFYLDDLRLLTAAPEGITAVVEQQTEGEAQAFALAQNWPNPFNSETTIGFALPHGGPVELAVFNLAGQKVATLAAGQRAAGRYTLQWDGRDSGGRELASGVYLYRLQAGERVETRKLLLMK